MNDYEADVAHVQQIEAIPIILDVLCQTTGMRFAAVARVTEDRWIACGVLDRIEFGLKPGGELDVETTICHEVRQAQSAVYIDRVADHATYAGHPTAAMYGFQSYISEPILLKDGTFFGTLCSIDPEPAKVDNPRTRSMFRLYAQLIAFHLDARTQNETLERLVAERSDALALSEAALRQSQKMEAVGQLTGGLAHDFNNLLTGISGSLELLQIRTAQGRTGSELERYVRAAQGAAKRAAALTHRLLAFSRRQTLDPKPTDINRLITDVEELLRRSVEPAVQLEFIGASGLWIAQVDANQLENALLNLCINARDAMPEGGRITVETANKWLDERAAKERDMEPGQYLSICVTDTGTGMTPEVIEHAFEPFFTTKPIGTGTGLGLSMVYGFTRQSGGQVRIYSEIGHGTTICLYLPRYLGALEAEKDPTTEADVAAPGSNITILIVDDEPTIRMLVIEVLADFGYDAVEAVDGQAGLRILQSDRRIDLLVTDVGLPGGLNGRQLADAGRALRPGLDVLFITGYADNAVIAAGHLDQGMNILTKPFAVNELGRRIKDIVLRNGT